MQNRKAQFAGMAGRVKQLATDSADHIANVLSGANARIPAFAGGGLAGGGGSGQPVTVTNHFEINGTNLDAKQIIDEAERRVWDGFTRESKLR